MKLLPDPTFDTLAEVLDPEALAERLHDVPLGPPSLGAIRTIEVRVLRHIPGRRWTLEFGVRTERGSQVVIGKIYRKHGADVFATMREIQQRGFGPYEEFSIPAPLAYVPSLSLLLQERVEGPAAEEIFWTDDGAGRVAAAERSALWLARFHRRAPRSGPESPPDDYLDTKRMRQCAPEIARLGGSLADKVMQLHALLEDAVASLAPVDLCAGHGAYRPDHVVLCPDRTVVLDFDRHDVADPARDAARFLVALRRTALELGSVRALDEPYEVFRQTYLAAGPSGAESNLPFFEASACLKRAKRILKARAADEREHAEAMLDEGLRVLERSHG